MQKINPLIILLAFICLIGISGCIDNKKANSTWGEKKISLNAITVSNNTVGNRSEGNESIYYVSGYLINNNPFEALDPKIEVITYNSNGTVFVVNNTPYMNPKNLPANDKSYFYARFEDPDKIISKFEVKVVDAKGEID